jgi:hypothetical protein
MVVLFVSLPALEQCNSSSRIQISCPVILCVAFLYDTFGLSHSLCAVRYGERAWTRLEAMSMYAVSVLKQVSNEMCADVWAVPLYACLA